MGQRRCCVPDCKSSSQLPECQDVKFHQFPANSVTRNSWVKNCHIEAGRQVSKNNVVCSRHFLDTDYQTPKNGRRMLSPNAVPTVFSWDSEKSVTEPIDTSSTAFDTSTKDSANKTADAPADVTPVAKPKKMSSRSQANTADIKQRTASAEEEQTPVNTNTKVSKIRKSVDTATTSDKAANKDSIIKSPGKKFDIAMQLTPGAKVEAQDLTGTWHNASVVEVDQGEQEVLINFEKKTKGSSGFKLNDEWIAMDSSRLRIPVQVTFKEGDRCLARWTDSRKFPATVVRPLENNKYEVLFDDGLVKYVKGIHMSKIKRPANDKAGDSATPLASPVTPITPIQPILRKSFKINPIPKFDLSEFNLPEIPDGEWCCPWINDTPIGDEGFLMNVDGTKRPTVLVQDNRLPAGWTKHLYQRSSTSGKWDVVLVGPNNKRFRSKNDVKIYLDEISKSTGQPYNLDIYDFSIHKRRAKDIGVYVFTKDYVPPVVPKPGSDFRLDSSLDSSLQQEPFTGFTPNESTSSILSKISQEIKTETGTPIKIEPNTSAFGAPEEGFIYVGALKVQLVDNLFQCPKEGCNKTFRKENHLQIHVKHYHSELSVQLGACPNMAELAYFRTMGTSIDESSPKNQIPNSQFFEKTFTSEMRTVRKSLSPTRIKVEPKVDEPTTSTPIAVDERASESLKRKLNTSQSMPEVKEKRKPSAIDKVSTPEIASNNSTVDFASEDIEIAIASTPIKKSDIKSAIDSKPVGSKAIIPRFKIGSIAKLKGKKSSPKKGKSFKKKFKKFNKDHKRKSYDGLDGQRPLQSEDGTFTTGFSRLSRPNRFNKFLQYSSTDSNSESSVMDPNIQQRTGTQYVDENGEIIKIVRMRQEEIINCVCRYYEEDGLMIQCELCLCWQHGGCNKIQKESEVPEKYVCHTCRHPDNIRESMRYVHDQDWLYDGKLFHANYHQPSRQATLRSDILKQSHTLTGNLLEMKRSLHSLNVKINIASNKDHPKLYLWSKKWEQSPPRNTEVETKMESKPTVQPAPHTSSTQVKNETVGNSEPNTSQKCADSENSTKESAEKTNSTTNNSETVQKNETAPVENKTDVKIEAKEKISAQQPIKAGVTPKNIIRPNIPKPEAAIDSVECQHRLLEHIQKEQNAILARMQTIDAQIVALESMDDRPCTNTEADYAKTSQTIRMLLSDLAKMKRLAAINRINKKDEPKPKFNSMEPSQFV